MPLTLRIQSYRKQALDAAVERRFDRLGGTIGRASESDLHLPDPAKYISRTHARIDYVDGRFTLVDLGSNPSWVNDQPLGTGKSAVLADGDRLTVGDYVLEVAVDEAPPAPVPLFAPGHPFDQPTQPEPEYVTPVDPLSGASILDTGADLAAPGAYDPLGLNLLGQEDAAAGPDGYRGSEPDHVPPQHAAFGAAADPPPTAVEEIPPVAPPAVPAGQFLIPDDYDPLADLLAPRAQPAIPAPIDVPKATATPATDGDSELIQALLRGLGVPDLELDRPPAQTAELVGAMLREATAGTMAVLLARAMTKRESRLELTVLGAQANNPLKFFPDAESALAQMLTNAMAGYMAPSKAYASAFDDLKAHEMAVIAGMRAALAGVLARFDPALVERGMEPEGVMDKMLSSSRKAKLWDRMVELYGEIVREAEDDFQRLFGERFSAAYEDQIARLNQKTDK
ncbi:type VI secretion system-associated FHA domain protein TagH [Massilia horti]|uniref:Type VI secretion system-associated FHA domain protein TagH n=1 Tax=Massilia horti TaxID=2562153 RepID=A0A4Y9T4T9_9BURK|nr:type VI secretion system-associated FHA domain protein TagH [Massilia horti]TFW31983.1 type VI secretion system-associated FHA domain protein TagH [Massilia horti]